MERAHNTSDPSVPKIVSAALPTTPVDQIQFIEFFTTKTNY